MATTSPAKKKTTFALSAPGAKNVLLAGNFTDWEASPKPMKPNKSGVWKVVVSLAPGRYEYRFIVDGQWVDDPSATERAANPYGGCNCVLVVDQP
jgi:1,4-alpha-glucan branching enzyme